ncbi:uncharacterized protein LOC112126859 [Cimex lectularius]|uniref:PPIase cyclophilin-type domain-containing protein n=1 Tax=Cimex lectularius TaxID=79782 RepID=A0A8I6TJR7_CIMLE|nr:uncharacterized protein LOC112126859 [Cimex lectularius]
MQKKNDNNNIAHLIKDEGNKIIIRGLVQTKDAYKVYHLAKQLHKYIPKKFTEPDFKLYPLPEWLQMREELRKLVRYRNVHDDYAVFLNERWIGEGYELLVAIHPHCIFYPDVHKFDGIDQQDQMLLYGVDPKKSCIYFDLAVDHVKVGRVIYEIYTDIMPKVTERFMQLCQNKPTDLREKQKVKYTVSEESKVDEKYVEEIFNADDRIVFRKETEEYLTYVDTEITRLLSPSFFQSGKIKGLDEWYTENLELEASHEEFGNISLMSKKTKKKNHRILSTSQFIISLKPNQWMNKYFRCIGRIIHGHYVLNVIKDIPTTKEAPDKLITIIDCGVLYTPEKAEVESDVEEEQQEPIDEDDKMLKEYEDLVNLYYAELCEIQGLMNDKVVQKEILYCYNMQECDEYSVGNESDTDSELMLYDQMEALDQDNPLKVRYSLNVHKTILVVEELGHKLYEYMRPTLLERLLPEEIHLKETPTYEGHDFMLECELASESSEEWLEFSDGEITEEEKAMDTVTEIEIETLEFDEQPGEWIAEEFGSIEHVSLESNISVSSSTGSEQLQTTLQQSDSSESSLSASAGSVSIKDEKLESTELSEHEEALEFTQDESYHSDKKEPERIVIDEEDELPDYVTPIYLLEQKQDKNKIPRQILEYIFKCVYKHRKHVTLDEETISIMQTASFKSKLATLPSEILFNIARKMDGIEMELAEMERTVKTEEERKKYNDVISNAVVEFTTNMIEFLLHEVIDNAVINPDKTDEEEVEEILPESPIYEEEATSLDSASVNDEDTFNAFNDDLLFQI